MDSCLLNIAINPETSIDRVLEIVYENILLKYNRTKKIYQLVYLLNKIEKQVLALKIKKYSYDEIAIKINKSTRQVFRIWQKIKHKYKYIIKKEEV